MQGLKEIIISLTNRCNLRCRMCEIPRHAAKEMSTEEVKRVLSEAAKLSAKTVVFSGGEPMLRKDIFALLHHARECKLEACLTSNGVLLDDEACRKLAEAKIKVVNVSLEGPQEVHEQLRGKGSFAKAVAALKNLQRHNVEATAACTVSRCNYRSLPELMEIAVSCGVTSILLQPFNPLFLSRRASYKEFYVPPGEKEAVAQVMEQVIVFARQHRLVINPETYLRRIPAYLAQEPLPVQHSCQALWSSCAIDSSGNVQACWAYVPSRKPGIFPWGGAVSRTLGNVTRHSLVDIWLFPSHSRQRSRMLITGCKGCLMSCYGDTGGEAASLQTLAWMSLRGIEEGKRLLQSELGGGA